MPITALPWLLSLTLSTFVSLAHAADETEARAMALEKKLLAPCCWQGTLEVHHSELADSLHAEIRSRLRAGESLTSIEESMVARFGPRLIAVPSPGVLEGTAGFVMLALIAVGAGVWMLGRSWSRHGRRMRSTPASDGSAPESAYDARIDSELERLS
jgi:cytochrome c-type biogenesis protein CcmH